MVDFALDMCIIKLYSQYVGRKTIIKERGYKILGATIGDTLKELRRAKHKTVVAAANGIGITPSALSNYENNLRVPRDDIKIAISEYYKKPIQKIFFTQNAHDK